MEPGREVTTPAPDDPTPMPIQVAGLSGAAPPLLPPPPPAEPQPPAVPTPVLVLAWVAASEGSWFPSRFAAQNGVPRESLDDPLAELRLAGLVRVTEWVRGVGQGYALTAAGKTAVADKEALERLQARAADPSGTAPPPMPSGTPQEDLLETESVAELILRPPVVVPALLLLNVLWFFVCAAYGIRWGLTLARSLSEGHPEVLARFGAVTGTDLIAGDWWRLLSSCFVHVGALHLIGNMFALALMGPLAELLWGRARLLTIYIMSGLAGSAVAMALRPDVLLAGASGAIWGIQMSLFVWLFTFRRHLPPELAADWFRRLGLVFVLNAGVSFLPGVSWEAHLGGGLAGLMTAGLLNSTRFGDPHRRGTAWLLLALMPAMCVGGLWAAMDAKGMPGWQHLRERLQAQEERKELLARQKQQTEARAAFYAGAVPRLLHLDPMAVGPVQKEAGLLLQMKKRPVANVEGLRKKVELLKATADEVVKNSSGPPTGDARFDAAREQVRMFAAARVRSFELLLALLAADALNPATLAEWDATRAEANRLWAEVERDVLVPSGVRPR